MPCKPNYAIYVSPPSTSSSLSPWSEVLQGSYCPDPAKELSETLSNVIEKPLDRLSEY